MLAEIPPEEHSAALDAAAAAVLEAVGIVEPPVDAFQVAKLLGMVVASSPYQAERARFVRLADHGGESARGSIMLRGEPRGERRQWAVAHEIGEQAAHDVFHRLGVDALEAPTTARESVANQLAGRLLLPTEWFHRDATACDWDLIFLKSRYHTASHELIARRMLEFEPAIIIGQRHFDARFCCKSCV